MFTGIVEHVGRVGDIQKHLDKAGNEIGWDIIISEAAPVLVDCHEGDSIAVNGTCLTVTRFTDSSFTVGVMNETLRKTCFGDMKVGDKVSLERAMSSHTRFGGHFVQGHVDDTVTISRITPDGEALVFEFKLDNPDLFQYIVPKGYVTLDGTSLTVCQVNDAQKTFTICMIVYTQAHVALSSKKVGARVNMEVDMLGKYVQRVISNMLRSDNDSQISLSGLLQVHIDRAIEERLSHRKI